MGGAASTVHNLLEQAPLLLYVVLVQVLPYWTKGSLMNLAAVVCWRHAASLKPAAIRMRSSPAAAREQSAEQGAHAALSCIPLPRQAVPLEVRLSAAQAATPNLDAGQHCWPSAAGVDDYSTDLIMLRALALRRSVSCCWELPG